MTNFNFGMVLDWKSEPHDSLVASQPHTHTRTHARLVCETHIADTIVSKSCVKLILLKKWLIPSKSCVKLILFNKVAYRTQNVVQERLSITCETLMTQIRMPWG